MTDDEREDELADNMEEVSRLAAIICSISNDINFELEEQSEQCARIVDKVRRRRRMHSSNRVVVDITVKLLIEAPRTGTSF